MFKNYLVILVVLTILIAPVSCFGQADGVCPLPSEYRFDCENGSTNDSPEGDTSLDNTLHKETLDSDSVGQEPHYTYMENESNEYKLLINGGSVEPDVIKKDNLDNEADAEKENDEWSPNEKHHPDSKDGHPFKMCWTFQAGSDDNKWEGKHKWKISSVSFAYHFDSPTVWGETGGIGDNSETGIPAGEGSEDQAKHPGEFNYVVPSAPLNYYVTSVLTLKWK